MKERNNSSLSDKDLKRLMETIRDYLNEKEGERPKRRRHLIKWPKKHKKTAEEMVAQTMPTELNTPAAWTLWHKFQEKGWIDEQCMPTVSHPRAALIADLMADKLHIDKKWKVFGEYWGIKNLGKYLYRGTSQRKNGNFMVELNHLDLDDTPRNTISTN